MSFFTPAAGRKRAHSLDLQDIASAIRNLPADAAAAFLPSPVPASLRPLAKRPKQDPAQEGLASVSEEDNSAMPSTDPSASEVVFQRALALARHTGTQRVQDDQALGRYGAHAEETAGLVRRLAREQTARQTRTVDVLDAAGRVSVDGEAVQILAQSLAGSATTATTTTAPPAYVACPDDDGTVWLWTKYYKGVWGRSADQQVALRRRPGPQPTQQPAPGPATRPAAVAFDLVSSLASCPELVLQMCCSLRLRDILVLYRVSRVFKRTLDAHLGANVLFLARHLVAPDTLAVFPWRLYRCTTRTTTTTTTTTPAQPPVLTSPCVEPTLRYLGLLVSRERKVRDILACLARAGHRLPWPTAAGTLKKMWLLLDVATNRGRLALLRNEALFTDADLLNIVMFYVKLTLHFHEPLYGPNCHGLSPPPTAEAGAGAAAGAAAGAGAGPWPAMAAAVAAAAAAAAAGEPAPAPPPSAEALLAAAAQDLWRPFEPSHPLVETLLGQRGGLHVLWALLRGKQYRTAREVVELKVRYDYLPPADALTGPDATGHGSPQSPDSLRADDGFAPADLNDYPPANSAAADATPPGALHDTIHAVPLWEMGVGHLEGWGLGTMHLFRPDELAPLEAERRRRADPTAHLDLRRHLPLMAVWGCRDFATGENLVPTLDELYMSDDGDDDDGEEDEEDEEDEDGEDAAAGDPLEALLASSLDAAAAPTAEQRLTRRCGNVPFRPGEWKPWQVLKKQWATLPLQDRLDIWWINHQQRLKNQAWGTDALEMHEAEQARATAGPPGGEAAAGPADGNDADPPLPYEYDVCGDLFALDNDYQDHPESPRGSPPWFSAGAGSGTPPAPSTTFSTASTAVHHPGLGSGSASRATSGVSMASSTAAFSAAPPSWPWARTPSSSTTAGAAASSSSYATLPPHDQRLVTASVRSALRAHDAVDAALVAQADEAYDEYDLALWEQTLAATGNDLLSETGSGEEEDDEASGHGTGTEGGATNGPGTGITDNSSDLDSNASVDTAAAAPRPPPAAPHTVLTPAYGGDDDALQLLQRLQKANAGLAAAELWLHQESAGAVAAAAQPTPGMAAAMRERTRRIDEREWLQKKLERQITAEVFAMLY